MTVANQNKDKARQLNIKNLIAQYLRNLYGSTNGFILFIILTLLFSIINIIYYTNNWVATINTIKLMSSSSNLTSDIVEENNKFIFIGLENFLTLADYPYFILPFLVLISVSIAIIPYTTLLGLYGVMVAIIAPLFFFNYTFLIYSIIIR